MSERVVITLEDAAEFCHERATWRDRCVCCAEAGPYLIGDRREQFRACGWEDMSDRNGMVLYCNACRDTYPRAWVGKLDRERVQKWMQAQNDKANGEAWWIDFEDLRRSCS